MLMIQLGKAGSHFAAAGSGCGYDNERTAGFDIIVFAVAFFADDFFHVGRITLNNIVDIAADAEGFELFAEQVRSGLTGILCDDNASDVKTDIAE